MSAHSTLCDTVCVSGTGNRPLKSKSEAACLLVFLFSTSLFHHSWWGGCTGAQKGRGARNKEKTRHFSQDPEAPMSESRASYVAIRDQDD